MEAVLYIQPHFGGRKWCGGEKTPNAPKANDVGPAKFRRIHPKRGPTRSRKECRDSGATIRSKLVVRPNFRITSSCGLPATNLASGVARRSVSISIPSAELFQTILLETNAIDPASSCNRTFSLANFAIWSLLVAWTGDHDTAQ